MIDLANLIRILVCIKQVNPGETALIMNLQTCPDENID